MTPRERAEAVVEKMGGEVGPDKVFWPETWRRTIETAITEHIRALLADNEETIEVMAMAAWREADFCEEVEDFIMAMRTALAALRRKAGVE
jgi:hypothetical protein